MTLPNEADIKCPKCADIMIITKIEGIEVEKMHRMQRNFP